MSADARSNRRRGLGRGLGALISSSDAAEPSQRDELIAQAEAGGILLLPVTSIQPNPHQPREHFESQALAELAASLAEHGVIQPLIVTRSSQEPDQYWLIAGERRWRAAQLAELDAVPALVREATPQQLLEWALVENLQRADLNPLEEAGAYRSLMEEFGLTHALVAQRVGKSRSTVTNALRLLELPQLAQHALVDGRISAGHARALLPLADPAAIAQAIERIGANGLSVRQTEVLVRQWLQQQTQEPAPVTDDSQSAQHQISLRALEDRFRTTLGTRVNLERRDDGSGRLVVHFYNDEDLDSLFLQIVGDGHL